MLFKLSFIENIIFIIGRDSFFFWLQYIYDVLQASKHSLSFFGKILAKWVSLNFLKIHFEL